MCVFSIYANAESKVWVCMLYLPSSLTRFHCANFIPSPNIPSLHSMYLLLKNLNPQNLRNLIGDEILIGEC